MDKYQRIAEEVLSNVGGKENVSFATCCITRLRLNVKEKNLVDLNKLKAINGVLGAQYVGQQLQVIIGTEVTQVYSAFCDLTGLQTQNQIQENLDESLPKEKLTFKNAIPRAFDAISASIVPIIPVFTVVGLIRLVLALIGPNYFGWVSAESNFMVLMTAVADAGLYYLPVLVAYGASKRFKSNTVISVLLAVIMLHPTILGIVNAGEKFTVFGIPMTLVNYSYSFIPVLLVVIVQSYVEKLLNKIVPNVLRLMLIPLGTVVIMLPLAFCVLGPIGSLLGQWIADFIMWLYDLIGPVAVGLTAAAYPFLIATGMHQAMGPIAVTAFTTMGHEDIVFAGGILCHYSVLALALVYAIKAKSASERTYGVSSALTHALGGVSEPIIIGLMMRYKKTILPVFIGGFIGGLYAGIMHCGCYFFPSGTILSFMAYGGGPTSSLVHGIIASVITLVVTFVLLMFTKFVDDKPSEPVPVKK